MNTNLGWLLQLSYWQSAVAFLFLFSSFLIIYVLARKKSFKTKVIISLILAMIGSIIFYLITINSYDFMLPNINNWYYQVKNWLILPFSIYASLTLFFIPLFIFSSVVKIFLGSNKFNFSKSIFVNFINIIIGFAVALIFIPFISNIDFNVGEPIDGVNNLSRVDNILDLFTIIIPSSLAIFASFWLLISIAIFSIFLGLILKSYKNKNKDNFFKVSAFFESFKFIIDYIFDKLKIMLPLVIATFIPIFFSGNSILNLGVYFKLILIFMFGGIVIYLIQTSIIRTKHRNANFYKINDINFNSSLMGSNAVLSRIENDFSHFTTSNQKLSLYLSSTSSLSMSAGFSSTFIYLIYILNTDINSIPLAILAMFFIVLITSFITVGFWGGDYIINTIILGGFGLPLGFIGNILLPIELFLRPIKNFVDSNGIIMNSYLLMDKSSEYKRRI